MILPRMKQDFIKDFDELIKAFDNNVPFVISRYGDGEIRVLQKIRIRRSSGWSCLNPKTHPLAKRLRKSFEYHDPGYYKGILCPCCVENMNRWYRRHTNHPIHQLTFASIFIRANHRFFSKMARE